MTFSDMKTILVTGGAGFIGTNFIRHTLKIRPDVRIINLDALTYAGNAANLSDLDAQTAPRYRFVHGSINDEQIPARWSILPPNPTWTVRFKDRWLLWKPMSTGLAGC
jgi:dTDP-D-glucose 4,6-dehydratase